MAKKQVEKSKEAAPVVDTKDVNLDDKEMLAKAKEEGGIPDPGVDGVEAAKTGTPDPTPEPKVDEPKGKTQAEIEAEVNAFLGTLQPKASPKAKTTVPDKSQDGKTPEQLIEEGRTAEAMDLVATRAARRERDIAMTEIQGNQAQVDFNNKRLEANKKVYMAHPELLDIDKGTKKAQDVPFALTISQVYNEYPKLLETPEGPLMAMEIAEKRLGVTKVADTPRQADQSAAKAEQSRGDASRAAAIIASSSASGRPPAPEVGDVQLSDDESLVAGKMGLTNVEYGRMREKKSVFGPDYYAKHRGGPRPRRG
jgi:hypothetical protein